MICNSFLNRCVSGLLLAILISSFTQIVVAQASSMVDLYSAEVELADNSATTQQEAFKQALAKVLIKLSGTEEIRDAPETATIINHAARYVQSYRKDSSDNKTDTQSIADKKPTTLLRVEFDGAALERALIAASLPVWSGTRPSTLVWLAVQDKSRRYVLDGNSKSKILPLLEEIAAERGLPILLPLMDQVDQSRIEFIDIRAAFTDRLIEAAERYNTAVMLVGSLQTSNGSTWNVKWTVLSENVGSSWIESELSLEQIVRSGIGGLADILASRYAFVSTADGASSEFVLSVNDISSLDQYARILNMLEKLVFVGNVTPIYAKENQVNYRVRMRGQLQELERALGLSKELQALETIPRRPSELNKPDVKPAIADRDRIDLYFVAKP